MSLAQFADPITVIQTLAELGKRGQPMTRTPDIDTLERVSTLIRRGALRGIHPQWALKKAPGVTFTQDELEAIATQVEECFKSGEVGEFEPKGWILTFYE